MNDPNYLEGRRRTNQGFTLIELMAVIVIIAILAVLAIFGVRLYVANAKTGEARANVGQIGKDAQVALEREIINPAVLAVGGTAALNRRLCLSATATVPAAATSIKGMKYQPDPTPAKDYHIDAASTGVGFACLKFEITTPQYYLYNYTSDATATAVGTKMSAIAQGDLNGDGTLSTFQLDGAVSSETLRLAPSIAETNPEE